MKRNYLKFAVLASAIALSLSACLKNDASDACQLQDVSLEQDAIESYIDSHGFRYELDSTGVPFPVHDTLGLQYQILDSGSKEQRFEYTTDRFDASYQGRLINVSDGVFADTTTLASNGTLPQVAYNVISAWSFVLLNLNTVGVGGHVRIFTPSAYAYGCTGRGVIPPNTPLFFDIKITAITR